jgi:hypothetical protein
MKKLIIGAAALSVIAGCAHGVVKKKADTKRVYTPQERAQCAGEGWDMVMMSVPTDAAASVEYWDRLSELSRCAYPKQEQGEGNK